MSKRMAIVLGALVLGGGAIPASAAVFLTLEEALSLAFPGCAAERRMLYLDEAQRQQVARAASKEVQAGIVDAYDGRCATGYAGTAFLDTHVVRTKTETVMVVVDPAGRIGRVEVLTFNEPEEYKPKQLWYDVFRGKAPAAAESNFDREIPNVTGATLTAGATRTAVRTALALRAMFPAKVQP
ncbi:MAG: FMN-binding protein [Candidatus Schekmanbacteria bacterium]|nr:FMN-binding protein [Candidatus Schekmanbacteria bacterium]